VRYAKDAVAAFFAAFGSSMEVAEFTPVSFAANETDVLTVVRFRATSRRTGKTAAMDLHHFFRFRDGKIAYYRGTEDTAQTEAVLRD
jgi:ketosteroid isomerase-like protein